VQQVRLEREVDRARRDVERELLGIEVVFGHRHRERQGDAATETVARARQPAVDGSAGERPPGAVETRHAEQPEQRPLLAECRGGAGSGAPCARERLRSVDQALDRAVSH
jgi:hypothetical protein